MQQLLYSIALLLLQTIFVASIPLPESMPSISRLWRRENDVRVNATAYAPAPAANFTPPITNLSIIEKVFVNDGHGGRVKVAEVNLGASFEKFVPASAYELNYLAGELDGIADVLNMTKKQQHGKKAGTKNKQP